MPQATRHVRSKAEVAAAPTPPPIAVATGQEDARSSPALALQQQVSDSWQTPARSDSDSASESGPEGRWSPRSTLLFSGGVASLLWGAIAMAIYAATR